MKKILITGAGSYIGTSFEQFLTSQYPNEYVVDTVDTMSDWQGKSFAGYDAVFHVAGLAHQKETAENTDLYHTVNCELAVRVAQKAKEDGVGQFIFLSSMNIYGMESGIITPDTVPQPKTYYGKSKWQAEQALAELISPAFSIAFLRPPMVYGKDCRGNFQMVVKLVKKLPFFPRVHNQRTLIHIDNLCAFVKLCVDQGLSGVYFPQNAEAVDTYVMAQEIASEMGKKLYFSYLAGLGVAVLRSFWPVAKKAFGSLVYKDTETFDFTYCVTDMRESIRKSV